jgi:CubicO group peptidase (beta-lactamase class C family)
LQRLFSIALLFLAGLFAGDASGQTDVPAELLDRPPVAAPTDRIDVAPIQVVRSVSEQIDDFSAGLIRGAAPLARVPGVAFVAVRDDHIVVQRNFGTLMPDTAFDAGTLSDLFLAVSAMREIEQGKLALDDDVSKPLGETSPRGITIGQLLTHRAGNTRLLAQALEKAAGSPAANMIATDIFQPMLMTASSADADDVRTSAVDIAHLLIALVNNGMYDATALLQPASIEAMEQTHFTDHPALAGWTYGFAELRRNGWLALVHDGLSPNHESRVVVVPEARFAYVLVVEGHPGSEFWRTVDDALFDRAFAPRAKMPGDVRDAPAPSEADARMAAGLYEITNGGASSLTALKRGVSRIRVRAGENGTLLMSGAENAVLAPRAGGYWASDNGNVSAALVHGQFVVGSAIIAAIPIWQRPRLYLLLALLAGFAGAGALGFNLRRNKRSWRNPGDLALACMSASVSLLVLSAFIWFLSPAV